jgi:hypothetical protein
MNFKNLIDLILGASLIYPRKETGAIEEIKRR